MTFFILYNIYTVGCQLSEHIGTKGCSDKKIVRISKSIINLKLGGYFLEVQKCKLLYISRVEHSHKHNTFFYCLLMYLVSLVCWRLLYLVECQLSERQLSENVDQPNI